MHAYISIKCTNWIAINTLYMNMKRRWCDNCYVQSLLINTNELINNNFTIDDIFKGFIFINE